jgi:ABC-2 type transport system ATP-binding protein/lipopolysaccharide transport system ATP-binding protein
VEALRAVTLDLRDGDRLGLIGPNGSGKSTLLRVVGGVYEPSCGRVRVSGRVLSLSDPMLGMSLDCTGRDNVVLRGIYVGLTPRQALGRLDEIAAFAELEGWMNVPLKAWSSGMQLRLSFAVATMFEPDILLLDEEFLAGDSAFREKAERRLDSFVRHAGIVIQTSHSERLIRETCTRVLLLERGCPIFLGSPDDAFALYRGRTEKARARAV